jgi:GAF domain-containing protein
MKRRFNASGKSGRARRSKVARNAAARRRSSANEKTEIAQLARERDEAMEQLAAASEVLKVISSSPSDLKPVFDTILKNATRICRAKFGNLWLREGDQFRIAETSGAPPAYREYLQREPIADPEPESAMGRIARTHKVVQIDDITVRPTYGSRMRAATIKFAKARTLIGVPMLNKNELVGIVAIYRQEVRPFTAKQIALVETFAAQAVIAIENTRLLSELRQSLEQQTATAEVLQVINSSAGSLRPVFEAMLDKAMQLCEAAFGGIWTLEGDRYAAVALQGVPEPYAAFLAGTTLVPGPGTAPYRIMHGEAFVHNVDLASEEPYRTGDPQRRALVDLGGARTALQAALRKDDAVLGIITIYRQEVRPYTDKQIELLQNFAAQAVVAMENARLLNELRQRTADLSESLEQQTATSEVLRVISSSAGDVEPVFRAILENGVRLCGAMFGNFYLREGDGFRVAAMHNAPPAYAEQRAGLVHPSPYSSLWRAAQTKQPAQIADMTKLQVIWTAIRG